MFVLTALTILGAASPAAVANSSDRWRAMSTQELAAKLLPRRLARRVVEHEFASSSQVTFTTRTSPTPDGFCERDQFTVPIAAPPRLKQSADIYRGDCPAEGIAGFVHVTPNPQLHVAQAKLAIRWLEGAIAAARASQPLPFDIDCVSDTEPSLCADARAALASLSVQNMLTVGGAFTCKPGEAMFALRPESGATQGAQWQVEVSRGTARPQLKMRWTTETARS